MNRRSRLPSFIFLLFALGCGGNRFEQLIQELSSLDDSNRRRAIAELAKIENPPSPVVDAIHEATQDTDRDVRRIAYQAIGNLEDPNHQEKLETGLQDPELAVRMAVAYALLKLNDEHPGAIDVLSKAMKLGDGGVIVAIGRENYSWAVPTLIELLRDRRPGTRRLAAESLGMIGEPASDALPALRKAAKDRDDRVRGAASKAKDSIQGARS